MTEFESLFNVLKAEKQQLCEDLNKIDECIRQAINSYENTMPDHKRKKKKEIKTEIFSVVNKVIDFRYEVENLLEDLQKRVNTFEQDTQPEKDKQLVPVTNRGQSNPFLMTNIFTDISSASFYDGQPNTRLFPIESGPGYQQETPVTFETISPEVADESFEVVDIFTHPQQTLQNILISLESSFASLQLENVTIEPSFEQPVIEQTRENNVQGDNSDVTSESESETVMAETTTSESVVPAASESVKCETPVPLEESASASQGSALEKLMSRPIYDRYQAAVRKYDRRILPEKFNLVEVPKSPISVFSDNVKIKKKKKRVTIEEMNEFPLEEGDICHFSYIKNPGEFYLRNSKVPLEGLENCINDLLNKENFHIVKKYRSKDEARELCGTYCYAFSMKRQAWVRVKILNWDGPDTDVNVFLVDYGEKDKIDYSHLRTMDEDVAEVPTIAVKCHLACILPVNGRSWSESSGIALRKIAQMDKLRMQKFTVCFVHKQKNSYAIDLVLGSSERTVGEILVDAGEALQEVLDNPEVDEEALVTTLDIPDEELQDIDNINEAITGYDAQDEARICPFTNSSGRCFKGARCKLEHTAFAPDGITTDKILKHMKAFNALYIPPAGTEVDILITAYKSTCRFFCHVLTEKVKSNLYNDNFQNLFDRMNCKKIVPTYEIYNIFPAVGEILMAYYYNDWYRGMCCGPGDDMDTLEIFMVDLGMTVQNKLGELRQIPEDFLHIPFQAAECILCNCEQKPNTPENEAVNFFFDSMSYRTFKAIIFDSREPLRIQMRDSQGTDFASVLVNYGLGVFKKVENIDPPKDSQLQLR